MITETSENLLNKKPVIKPRFTSPLDIEIRCEPRGEEGNYKKFWDPERKHYVYVKIYHVGDQ